MWLERAYFRISRSHQSAPVLLPPLGVSRRGWVAVGTGLRGWEDRPQALAQDFRGDATGAPDKACPRREQNRPRRLASLFQASPLCCDMSGVLASSSCSPSEIIPFKLSALCGVISLPVFLVPSVIDHRAPLLEGFWRILTLPPLLGLWPHQGRSLFG